MLDRGRLAVGLAGGSVVVALATALPAAWPVAVAAYVGWLAVGVGYTVVEVAAKTLLQRLGSDETLGRVIGSLESARLAAMALGSIGASSSSSCSASGARCSSWPRCCRLRRPQLDPPARLRGRRPGRRGAVPAAARQLDLRPAAGRDPGADQPRPGRGEVAGGRGGDHPGRPGRPLLPDRGGAGRGARRRRLPPQRGARRKLRRDRPAARRAPHRDRAHDAATTLLALERDQFISAVTGHRRSHQVAHTVVDDRWAPGAPERGPIPFRRLRPCRASSGGFRRSTCRCPAP